jgi:hypothetical protein
MYQGEFTRDDEFMINPFPDRFMFVGGVKVEVGRKVSESFLLKNYFLFLVAWFCWELCVLARELMLVLMDWFCLHRSWKR